jgi:hypothetical protein
MCVRQQSPPSVAAQQFDELDREWARTAGIYFVVCNPKEEEEEEEEEEELMIVVST